MVGGSVSQVRATGVTTVPASHQVILSQVSTGLPTRHPTPSTPTTTAIVRPIVQTQPPSDPQVNIYNIIEYLHNMLATFLYIYFYFQPKT